MAFGAGIDNQNSHRAVRISMSDHKHGWNDQLMVWWSKSASRDKGPVGRLSRENSALSHQTIDRN